MNIIEIQTMEGGRLEWVAIYGDTNLESAMRWGDTLIEGFMRRNKPHPHIRILDREMHRGGRVLGAWQAEGYEGATDA